MGIQDDLNYLQNQSALKKNDTDTVAVQQQIMRMAEENERRDATLVGQTNPKPLIQDLIHYYRCEIEVPNKMGGTKWERPQGVRPMMNEFGIHSVIIDVYSVVNQGTVLSNLTEEDVANITIQVHMNLISKLGMNWREYEIEKANLSTILWVTSNMCYMALKRGLNQGERGFLKKTVFSNETRNFGSPGKMPSEKKHFWEVWK